MYTKLNKKGKQENNCRDKYFYFIYIKLEA